MFNNEISMKAGGTIGPSLFVKLDTSADEQVIVAAANTDFPFGVSQEGMKRPPGLPGSDTTVAAESGDTIRVFTIGDDCLLLLNGTVTRGDLLMSDTNGKAITATSTNIAGARALQSGTSGAKIRVQLISPYKV